MTSLELVLVLVLAVIAVVGVVGLLVSGVRKDNAILENNAAMRHMATQFAFQLRMSEDENLAFAEMAMSNAGEMKMQNDRWMRHSRKQRERLEIEEDGFLPMSEADVNN